MIAPQERIPDSDIIKAEQSTRLLIPFFSAYVQTGFPSPVENYIERACDLNDLCVTNPEATYFVRVASDSMIGDRIDRGDLLVVDCSREAVNGNIVVVWLNGDHVVKRIHYTGESIVLLSSNPNYEPICVHPDDDFRIRGAVMSVIRRLS